MDMNSLKTFGRRRFFWVEVVLVETNLCAKVDVLHLCVHALNSFVLVKVVHVSDVSELEV